MKLSYLLPLSILAFVPLSSAEDCPGCSLTISPIDSWQYDSPDPACHTTIQLSMWSNGGDGGGECVSGINIETGATECKPAIGCYVSWAYSVDASEHSYSCTGVADPFMKWSYTFDGETTGESFNKFGYEFVTTGATRLYCDSYGTIEVDSNGWISEVSATCSPCDN